MTTIEKTNVAPQWQTFDVRRGVISRNPAGQIEGVLELGQGVALTFISDPDGSYWNWLPEEPHFVSDESGDNGGGNTSH
jgi:hypothetical protein